MEYFIKWLKAFKLIISLEYSTFHFGLLFFGFYFIKERKLYFSIHLWFPKYALIITNSDKYFFLNSAYRFYKKKLIKDFNFYILHVIGENATQIKGKESKWE
jgi:hypothetical protein